ncbi:Arf GTPase activating protein [Linnemannia elongata AG-77]|uniref:Arf GTPase activating protein n=1 Tax=Linnemannia elongata AG-77 TaxID=1314771 RepID=A0A197JUU2_9FUNG|nr:Arf GTPase activating protein [Linnemannia elongata AG-77]
MSERKLPMDKSERLLNELLKIPVNTICCDCGAANPNWASYSLGCFLCVRCCSVHRKMGTHISKVKSVSLDSWTQDDIDVRETYSWLIDNYRHSRTQRFFFYEYDAWLSK